jgi:hypothetical protein
MVAVWFLFLPEDRKASGGFRKRLSVICKERQWSFAERCVQPTRDIEGRPLHLLSPLDTNELYRATHRSLTAIVDTCTTQLLRDPRDAFGKISSRRTMRLSRLVTYKALLFNCSADSEGLADSIATALAGVDSDVRGKAIDAFDPRSLPFLPFELGGQRDENLQLDTPEGRLRFDQGFGPARHRRDQQDVSWKLDPRAYHGQETLLVRGRSLPPGFHWDVEIDRGTAHLCMAAEVWDLKRGQYLNVYADMHTRTTRDGGRRVWPKKT